MGGSRLFLFAIASQNRCYKCSYLHKRGFNGWHLVCMCWFHFLSWKSRCYKLKVVFSFFPLPLCKIYKCKDLQKQGFNGWHLAGRCLPQFPKKQVLQVEGCFLRFPLPQCEMYRCLYLHKRSFNGWHLVCLCWFHFFQKVGVTSWRSFSPFCLFPVQHLSLSSCNLSLAMHVHVSVLILVNHAVLIAICSCLI